MANEIQVPATAGLSLAGLVLNSVGQAWNTSTSAFEAINSANAASYSIALAASSITTLYLGSMPTAIVGSGTYSILAYARAGAALATSDLATAPVAGGIVQWTGSAVAIPPTVTTAGKVAEVVLVDTLTTYTSNTPQSGDAYARLGSPSGASVSADIATKATSTALASLVTTVGANGAGLTSIPYTGPSAGTIQAGLATATALASLVTTVGANGAGLTSIPYTGPSAGTIQAGLATSTALASLVTTVGASGAGLTSIPYTGLATSSAIASLASTLGTPASSSISTDIANLASGGGLFIPGTVSTATSASSFVVAFAGSAPPVATLVGLYCCITTPGRSPEKQQITSATAVDSTHLTLNFTTAFGVAPVDEDSVLVG